MTAPELMRAFRVWQGANRAEHHATRDAYPLYTGAPHDGRWYVRERQPGTRVWRAEEDGSFTLLTSDSNLIRGVDVATRGAGLRATSD